MIVTARMQQVKPSPQEYKKRAKRARNFWEAFRPPSNV